MPAGESSYLFVLENTRRLIEARVREREIAADEQRAQARIERAAGTACARRDRRNLVNMGRTAMCLVATVLIASCGRAAPRAGGGSAGRKGGGRGSGSGPRDPHPDERGAEAVGHRDGAGRAARGREDEEPGR